MASLSFSFPFVLSCHPFVFCFFLFLSNVSLRIDGSVSIPTLMNMLLDAKVDTMAEFGFEIRSVDDLADHLLGNSGPARAKVERAKNIFNRVLQTKEQIIQAMDDIYHHAAHDGVVCTSVAILLSLPLCFVRVFESFAVNVPYDCMCVCMRLSVCVFVCVVDLELMVRPPAHTRVDLEEHEVIETVLAAKDTMEKKYDLYTSHIYIYIYIYCLPCIRLYLLLCCLCVVRANAVSR